MSPANLQQAIRILCDAKPFLPFVIELMTRDRVTILDPQAIAARDGLVVVTVNGTRQFFDCSSVCQLYDLPKSACDDVPF
jgi:hypothetical protein